jgi:hypothetical protein
MNKQPKGIMTEWKRFVIEDCNDNFFKACAEWHDHLIDIGVNEKEEKRVPIAEEKRLRYLRPILA